ncbi:AsmA family protein [Ruegeria aquimaris]|uniref:AsmA family protein n=1 Tax=Ruegeria aquimaris TaxID=2984333 RepID=A0ABT3AJ68_9RHOB|nr:AsmA family protein [Ruegeria sp. XHP0148]MCV2888617.1 AsmA family protein [Ruegeria sp. XHP0148]
MRWIVRIGITLILALVVLAAALLMLPGDRLARLAIEQIRKQTGREVTVAGEVKLSFWPVLGVETGPVTVANADWADSAPMLQAQGLAIGVAAPALLGGEVRITRILANEPVLRLETAKGLVNWEFSPSGATSGAAAPSGPSAGGQLVTLDGLELKNARLVYVEEGKTSFDFGGVDLAASWPSADTPLKMQARLTPGTGSISVDLTLADLTAFSNGQVSAMQMTMAAPKTSITFDGRASLDGALAGRATLDTSDSAAMLAAFGQAGITLPRGLGQRAKLDAQITYTADGRLALRELAADLDGNRLNGAADVTVADPPQVTARLTAGALDLTGLGADSSGTGSGGSAPASGWSEAPIDASALALANGTLQLSAASIALPGLNLGQSGLSLSLDNSRAVVEMAPVSLFSGQLTGQLVANNRQGLSVAGDLRAEGIEMREALATLGGIERLSGAASGQLKFLGVGASEAQIMRSLSGEGRLAMGRGTIAGIDLDNLMGRGAKGGGTTVFNSLTASYRMDKGNLFNEDLLMLLDNFKANGTGRVGLGARDIDYLFTPVALRANAGQGLAVPVRIVGPWASPAIRPDLTQVIEKATGLDKEAVEAKAKDELRRKLGEELDTEIAPDQNVEDLIKDRLEQEATKGLLKLLGKN